MDKMGERGIYTIIDMHQDLMSRLYCGEGAPDYISQCDDNATAVFPKPVDDRMPRDEHGYPLLSACLKRNFGMYYFTDAVGECFHNLYTNQCGLLDKFLMYWKAVAEAFHDSPYVIGYVLFKTL